MYLHPFIILQGNHAGAVRHHFDFHSKGVVGPPVDPQPVYARK